jgi:ABC-type nickel/cobalt efflux system permease component RcnA
MKNDLSSRAVTAFALLGLCSALSANPFMGSGSPGRSDPVPVRVSAPDSRLVSGQAGLRESIAGNFHRWKESGDSSVLWGILGAAFLYGIVHALGPGHRKTVVFSLYLAREAPWWEPGAMSLALSLLHAGASVGIMLILRGTAGAMSGRAGTISTYMEGASFMLLAVLAFALAALSVRSLVSGRHGHASAAEGAPAGNEPGAAGGVASGGEPGVTGGGIGLGAFILSGVYPCPGAVLVLVLALSLDMMGIGIFSVLAMSLGMCLPIVAAAYLAWFGRTGLFSALKKNEAMFARVSAGVALAGYATLFAFALYMVAPFALGLVRR